MYLLLKLHQFDFDNNLALPHSRSSVPVSGVLFDETSQSTKQLYTSDTSSNVEHTQIPFESSKRKMIWVFAPYQQAFL
jgi:hypothetical protein